MATNRFQEEVNRQDSLKTSSMYNQPTTPTANTTSTANTTPVANTTPIDNTSGVFGTPKVDNVVSTSDLSKPPVKVADNSALLGNIQSTYERYGGQVANEAFIRGALKYSGIAETPENIAKYTGKNVARIIADLHMDDKIKGYDFGLTKTPEDRAIIDRINEQDKARAGRVGLVDELKEKQPKSALDKLNDLRAEREAMEGKISDKTKELGLEDKANTFNKLNEQIRALDADQNIQNVMNQVDAQDLKDQFESFRVSEIEKGAETERNRGIILGNKAEEINRKLSGLSSQQVRDLATYTLQRNGLVSNALIAQGEYQTALTLYQDQKETMKWAYEQSLNELQIENKIDNEEYNRLQDQFENEMSLIDKKYLPLDEAELKQAEQNILSGKVDGKIWTDPVTGKKYLKQETADDKFSFQKVKIGDNDVPIVFNEKTGQYQIMEIGNIPGAETYDDLTMMKAYSLVSEISPRMTGNKEAIRTAAHAIANYGEGAKDWLSDQLRFSQQSPEFKEVRLISNAAFSSLPPTKRQMVEDGLDDYLEFGDYIGARDYIMKVARENAPADEEKSLNARDNRMYAINKIENLLNEYTSKGGKTGLLAGNWEKVQNNVLKKTKNSELATIAGEIAQTVQAYRQELTGAAFTESEAREYSRLFPGIEKSPELNNALITSLKETTNLYMNRFYERALGEGNWQKLQQITQQVEFGLGNFETFYKKLDDNQLNIVNNLLKDGYQKQDIMNQMNQGFSSVGGDTNTAILNKVVSKKDGDKGGECGHFVNQITGLGLGNSFESKMAKMDSSITKPAPGMVFLTKYEDTGHTGFIVSVNNDGTATVKDSNYSLDKKIKTHKIALNKIVGLARV